MIGTRYLLVLATVFSITHATAVPEAEEWHTTMLKRQAPGTPAYACHSACGTAITLSRGTSPCTDATFLADYAECLACSGPDNINIWRYYGTTLSAAGTLCGLSTTPISGAPSSSAPVPAAQTTSSVVSTSVASTPVIQESIVSSAVTTSVYSTPVASSPLPEATSSSVIVTSVFSSSSAFVTSSPTSSAGNSTSTTISFTGAANSMQNKVAGAFAVVGVAVFAAIL